MGGCWEGSFSVAASHQLCDSLVVLYLSVSLNSFSIRFFFAFFVPESDWLCKFSCSRNAGAIIRLWEPWTITWYHGDVIILEYFLTCIGYLFKDQLCFLKCQIRIDRRIFIYCLYIKDAFNVCDTECITVHNSYFKPLWLHIWNYFISLYLLYNDLLNMN